MVERQGAGGLKSLAECNPVFSRRPGGKAYLTMDCPQCGGHPVGHRFTIALYEGGPLGVGPAKRWGYRGNGDDWNSFSVVPSFQLEERCRCHFTISEGQCHG